MIEKIELYMQVTKMEGYIYNFKSYMWSNNYYHKCVNLGVFGDVLENSRKVFLGNPKIIKSQPSDIF